MLASKRSRRKFDVHNRDVMKDNEMYKQALRQLVLFCLWIVAVRFSKGAALILMAILGVIWAFNGISGKVLDMQYDGLCA